MGKETKVPRDTAAICPTSQSQAEGEQGLLPSLAQRLTTKKWGHKLEKQRVLGSSTLTLMTEPPAELRCGSVDHSFFFFFVPCDAIQRWARCWGLPCSWQSTDRPLLSGLTK